MAAQDVVEKVSPHCPNHKVGSASFYTSADYTWNIRVVSRRSGMVTVGRTPYTSEIFFCSLRLKGICQKILM